jgi:hypothetical protein
MSYLIIAGDYDESMDLKYVGYKLCYVGSGFRLYRHEKDGEMLIEFDAAYECVYSIGLVPKRPSTIVCGDEAKIYLELGRGTLLRFFCSMPCIFFVYLCYRFSGGYLCKVRYQLICESLRKMQDIANEERNIMVAKLLRWFT